jgi:hypothetical protein
LRHQHQLLKVKAQRTSIRAAQRLGETLTAHTDGFAQKSRDVVTEAHRRWPALFVATLGWTLPRFP